MNKPVFHNVQQGADEWLALKAQYPFSASEAAAMLGLSPYKTRQQFLRQVATAGESEIYQPVADEGHRTESAARPIAEEIICNTLFPATVTREFDGLTLLASCDGLTMDGSTLFEHKQWNAEDAAQVAAGFVPEKHHPQLDQGMMVTGATRALFMISDGTEDNCESCWYEPNPEADRIILAGWRQFAEDLASYQHVEAAPSPVAAIPDSLPALLLDIDGAVRDTNLGTYQQVVTERIRSINTDLQTDQDFADAEEMVKFLDKAEKEIEAAKARALAQTISIDELFRAVDSLKEEMRKKRLELNRLVKDRKEAIRWEIVEDARRQIENHVAQVAEGLDGRAKMPPVLGGFREAVVAAMKGKRTIQTLRDAASQVVTDWKLDVNQQAVEIAANMKAFDELVGDDDHLFPDLATLACKPSDDFAATVKARKAEAAERDRQRAEAERERIRQEEARAKAAAEAGVSDARQSETPADEPTVESSPAQTPPHAPDTGMGGPLSGTEILPAFTAAAKGQIITVRSGRSEIYNTLTVDEATILRDSLTAALRQARKEAA